MSEPWTRLTGRRPHGSRLHHRKPPWGGGNREQESDTRAHAAGSRRTEGEGRREPEGWRRHDRGCPREASVGLLLPPHPPVRRRGDGGLGRLPARWPAAAASRRRPCAGTARSWAWPAWGREGGRGGAEVGSAASCRRVAALGGKWSHRMDCTVRARRRRRCGWSGAAGAIVAYDDVAAASSAATGANAHPARRLERGRELPHMAPAAGATCQARHGQHRQPRREALTGRPPLADAVHANVS